MTTGSRAEVVSAARVLLDEVALARHLCVVIEGIDHPGEPQIARWRSCIRVWAHRKRIGRFGAVRSGGRLYDLEEVMPVAERWLVSHPTHPAAHLR